MWYHNQRNLIINPIFFTFHWTGEECGDNVCEFGGECCMACDDNGKLVPSGRCSNPARGEPACPLIHCEPPIIVEPPIIIDPPSMKSKMLFLAFYRYALHGLKIFISSFVCIVVFCCEAITAECEACKLGMTVDEYCREHPKMDGCSPIVDGRSYNR